KYQNTNSANPNYTNDPTLAGMYIAFDAANANLAAGQAGNLNWGQAFGPAGTSWGNVSVPQYNADGTYAGQSMTVDASSIAIPSLTRIQAVKRAALTTWV